MRCRSVAIAGVLCLVRATAEAAARLPVTVERPSPGAPVTLGVPFPKGVLASPDQVRVLTADGREVPSQITEVTTRAPSPRRAGWAVTNGLRVFGWTHGFTVFYALAVPEEAGTKASGRGPGETDRR